MGTLYFLFFVLYEREVDRFELWHCSSNVKRSRDFESEFWSYSDNDAQHEEEDISDSDGNYLLIVSLLERML